MALFDDPAYKGALDDLLTKIYATSGEPGGGYGGAQKGTGSTQASGPYSGDVRELTTRGGLAALGALLGSTISPATIAGFAIPAASVIARAFGVPQEQNPMYGVPSLADIQDAMDYGGYYSGRAAKSAREAGILGIDPFGYSPTDYAGQAGNPAGWGGGQSAPESSQPSAVSPSTSAEGMDTGAGGASMGSGSATGDSSSPGDTGSADKAQGGVVNATHGPQRARFGEAVSEEAIFIPQTMRRPGIQGREVQVRRALQEALRALYR